MVIFNSYVKLPEATCFSAYLNLAMIHQAGEMFIVSPETLERYGDFAAEQVLLQYCLLLWKIMDMAI